MLRLIDAMEHYFDQPWRQEEGGLVAPESLGSGVMALTATESQEDTEVKQGTLQHLTVACRGLRAMRST